MLAIPLVFFVMVSLSWLGAAPLLLADSPPPMSSMMPPMQSPVKLIRSFEDLLMRQEGLLHSFKMLVGQFEVPPVELLKSYEDLLNKQAELLRSYEDLAKPFACTPGKHPELELVASFEKLLHSQAKLLGSFEALIHRHWMPPLKLVESFESLLKHQADLLHSFEGMLHCLAELHHLPPRTLYKFVVSFEELLRSQAGLLASFEGLIKGQGAPVPQLPSMPMPPQEPYEHPMESMLPSLEELEDWFHQGMEEMGKPRDLENLVERLRAQLKSFKEKLQMMRAHGHMEQSRHHEAMLAEFRLQLTRLQGELLQQALMVEMKGMMGAPGAYEVTVENRGPFAVSLATLLIFDGKRMVHSQSLGYLEPGARRTLMVWVDAQDPMKVRSLATGFIDFITQLMALAMPDR